MSPSEFSVAKSETPLRISDRKSIVARSVLYAAAVACNSVWPFMMANRPAVRSRARGDLRSIDLRR
jgi:hypothetical protein